MTKFGKCLVIFAVFASFIFLGAALVSWRSGPNWDAEASALPGYTIQKGDEIGAKWTVTDRENQQSVAVAAPTVAAAAVVAARKDLEKKQRAEIDALQKEADGNKQKLAQVQKLNAADVQALDVRVQELTRQLTDLNTNIMSLSNDVVKRSQEAQLIRIEAAKRREDVYRLSRELEEIRADNFRAVELQKKLQDQLVRLDGVVAALKDRNQQLHGE